MRLRTQKQVRQLRCSTCGETKDREHFDGWLSDLGAPGIFVDTDKPECDDCFSRRQQAGRAPFFYASGVYGNHTPAGTGAICGQSLPFVLGRNHE